jgi:tetratricopeptide (TPR) repeat protein
MATSDDDRTISWQSAFNLGVQQEKQGDLVGATAAYQEAIASGHPDWTPRAAYALGLMRDQHCDYVAAAAAYWIAIDSGHADVAFDAAVGLGHLHVVIPSDPAAAKLIQTLKLAQADYLPAGAEREYKIVIDSGHAEFAPMAAVRLGLLRAEDGDHAGAKAAYQIAIDSGHPYWAPRAAHYLKRLSISGPQS